MSTRWLSPLALPPARNITNSLNALADVLTGSLSANLKQNSRALPVDLGEQVLACLRLLSPYGEVTGLGARVPGQEAFLLSVVIGHVVEQADEVIALVRALDLALKLPEVTAQFPALTDPPRPNDNILWHTHARLVGVPVYDLIAADLQAGLIHLLARTHWQRTLAAQKVLDARLTGPGRILPRLERETLAAVMNQGDAQACGELLWQIAHSLNHLRTGEALDQSTRVSYFVDTCRLLNHPEWAAAHQLDTSLGRADDSNRRWSEARLMQEDDDPPETNLLPDGFRTATLEAIERRVRRALAPGLSLEMVGDDESSQPFNRYKEERLSRL